MYFAESIEQSRALMTNLALAFAAQISKCILIKSFSLKLIVPRMLMSNLLLLLSKYIQYS